MKSAALELGHHGITVNALIPGLIETPRTGMGSVTRRRWKRSERR